MRGQGIRFGSIAVALVMLLVGAGCGQQYIDIYEPSGISSPGIQEDMIDIAPEMVPLTATPAVFTIPVPTASGTNVKKNAKAEIDVSNIADGYFMVKYVEKTTKALKVLVKGPSGTQYQYSLRQDGQFEVYPFSDGNGAYTIGVYENVSGTQYAAAHSASIDVKLTNEFAPFIRPNQYVNYNKDSNVVKKAAELTKGAKDAAAQITAVYNYVVKNITYDKELAATVKSGYLPDVDAVLKKGKGICFDYAAVMTAMLRSQNIPTKLVVGYSGEIYHAWLSTYSKDTGWVDKVVYFDGKSWKLMDPTFASTGGQSEEVNKYIGNGDNYKAKYIY